MWGNGVKKPACERTRAETVPLPHTLGRLSTAESDPIADQRGKAQESAGGAKKAK
jgi:hypothetical protein